MRNRWEMDEMCQALMGFLLEALVFLLEPVAHLTGSLLLWQSASYPVWATWLNSKSGMVRKLLGSSLYAEQICKRLIFVKRICGCEAGSLYIWTGSRTCCLGINLCSEAKPTVNKHVFEAGTNETSMETRIIWWI